MAKLKQKKNKSAFLLTKLFSCCIIILVSWAINLNIAKMHFLPKKPKAKLKPLKINYLFTLLAQLRA